MIPVELKEPKTTKVLPVLLQDGATRVYIEATPIGDSYDEQLAAIRGGAVLPRLENVANAIQEISTMIITALKVASPSRASVDFGVEIALDSGQVTALIVKASSKASLNIKLEWEKEKRGRDDAP